MKKNNFAFYFLFFLCAFSHVASFSETDDAVRELFLNTDFLVEIPQLKNRSGNLFNQYAMEVEKNHKLSMRDETLELNFYKYTVKKTAEELNTISKIASRCNLRQETLATLNAINSPNTVLPDGCVLILPTANGVFVFEKPKSSLEILVAKNAATKADATTDATTIEKNSFMMYNAWYSVPDSCSTQIAGRKFYFVQNAKFSPTERAYFLDATLRMPLDNFWLSSSYGMRVSPISGKWRFHNGIDMAAKEGTAVFACKSGKVITAKKFDATYGNYVVILHDGNMTSLYAHLSEIAVTEGEDVVTSERIGKVGQTGLATGPHLHFEIRLNGAATDPQKLLKR